jgi:hypothetical protein
MNELLTPIYLVPLIVAIFVLSLGIMKLQNRIRRLCQIHLTIIENYARRLKWYKEKVNRYKHTINDLLDHIESLQKNKECEPSNYSESEYSRPKPCAKCALLINKDRLINYNGVLFCSRCLQKLKNHES